MSTTRMGKTMKGLTHNVLDANQIIQPLDSPSMPFSRFTEQQGTGPRSSIIVVVVVIDPRVSWPSAPRVPCQNPPRRRGSRHGVLDF